MLLREIIVRRQLGPVLDHRPDRLGVVPERLLEFLSLLQRFLAGLRIPHRVHMALNRDLLFFADAV